MELNAAARKLYTLGCTLTDLAGEPVDDPGTWEASFDGGTTWVAGSLDDDSGLWQWLVAGPLVDEEADPLFGATLAATLTARITQPIIRLVDNPEILAEDAPLIEMTS